MLIFVLIFCLPTQVRLELSAMKTSMQLERPLRVLHIGRYWRGLNSTVRHMMLGLKQMGADVYELDTDQHPEAVDTRNRPLDGGTRGPHLPPLEGLEPILQSFRPHVIL